MFTTKIKLYERLIKWVTPLIDESSNNLDKIEARKDVARMENELADMKTAQAMFN